MSRDSEVQCILRTEGTARGLAALLEIVSDPNAPKGVRVDAAKALLDRAGYVAPRAEAAPPTQKMLTEMSPAELADIIKECEDTLAARATVVHSDDPLQLTVDEGLATPAHK